MLGTLILIIPVLLIVTVIMLVIRLLSGDHEPGEGIIKSIVGLVPIIVVVGAAIIMITSMANIVDPPYEWDEDNGTLTINNNISYNGAYPWGSYASDVKNLIIENNVTVGSGAFDSLTDLEHVSIGNNVTIDNSMFSVDFLDPFGESVTVHTGQEYAGIGDGALYLSDPSIFTFSSDGSTITGLSESGTTAAVLVIPGTVGGAAITNIADGSQNAPTMRGGSFGMVLHTLEQNLVRIGNSAFKNCSSLASVEIPSSVTSIGNSAFRITALASVEIPSSVTSIGIYAFSGCASLVSVKIPSSVTSIGDNTFGGCASLVSVKIPSSVTSIGNDVFRGDIALASVEIPSSVTSIGNDVFRGCREIADVRFGSGFAATLGSNWAYDWTFYAPDGTTVIDKSAPANLAGKTFQGTAAALVEVSDGQLSLTPDQIQKVHLHDAELQDLKDHLTIDPLPFQPSLQTEQEQVAA